MLSRHIFNVVLAPVTDLVVPRKFPCETLTLIVAKNVVDAASRSCTMHPQAASHDIETATHDQWPFWHELWRFVNPVEQFNFQTPFSHDEGVLSVVAYSDIRTHPSINLRLTHLYNA